MAEVREFKLEPVPETDPPETRQPAHDAGIAMLMMGLKALSQRALVALSSLFTLITVGSAFWLWYLTPKPDVYQIVSLTLYAVFVLAANIIVRRA